MTTERKNKTELNERKKNSNEEKKIYTHIHKNNNINNDEHTK